MNQTPKVEFWSSVQFGGFMESLIRALTVEGVDARQRYLIDHDGYRSARGAVSRSWLRVRMYVIYPFYLALRLLRDRDPAILVISTNTFYAPLVALLLRKRSRQKVVHLVYDLFPDAMVHAGLLRERGLKWAILERIKQSMLQNSDANVFLGVTLRDHVVNQDTRTQRPVVIEVGATDLGPFPERSETSPVNVLYCGNLGRMHDIETLISVLQEPVQLKGRLTFHFHASGSKYSSLKDQLKEAELDGLVHFGDPLGSAEWQAALQRCPVALVTMAPGAESVVMPSKAYSALSAGQAILAVAPQESDLARMVTSSNCGWVVEPGDSAGLAAVLHEIAHDTAQLVYLQTNARKAFVEGYTPARLAAKWMVLFEELNS